jgi:hypothetical protein
MARASYGPHTVLTQILVVHGDGGGFTKKLSALRGASGGARARPRFCMVDARQGTNFPLWGNDSARETTRSARLSATPVTPVPPPLCVCAPHRISYW